MGRKKGVHVTEKIVSNELGEEIHEFDGPNGIARIKAISYFDKVFTGVQYCPYCHKEIEHRDEYWECPVCNYSILDEEVEEGDGFPTLEATYRDDFGW